MNINMKTKISSKLRTIKVLDLLNNTLYFTNISLAILGIYNYRYFDKNKQSVNKLFLF